MSIFRSVVVNREKLLFVGVTMILAESQSSSECRQLGVGVVFDKRIQPLSPPVVCVAGSR